MELSSGATICERLPALFGRTCTKTLTYIALNPLSTVAQIASFLGLCNASVKEQLNDRLVPMGLVVRSRDSPNAGGYAYVYEINPGLSGSKQFTLFLRELGSAYDIPTSRRHRYAKRPSTVQQEICRMPLDALWHPVRTRLLAVAAALGEFYVREASDALSLGYSLAQPSTVKLVREGVLTSRKVGNTRFYSLDTQFPGYPHLRRLLQRIASQEYDIRAAVHQIFARRLRVAARFIATTKTPILQVRSERRCPNGITKRSGYRAYEAAARATEAIRRKMMGRHDN